jgi:molecular chaperone GrpE
VTDERRTSDIGDGGPVIRDRRRIDPETGQPRTPDPEPTTPESGADPAPDPTTPSGSGTPPGAGAPGTPPGGGGSGTAPGGGNAGTAPGGGVSGAVPGPAESSGGEGAGTTGTGDGGGPTAREQELTKALAERTADLQRLQAEYVNYKRRVDRDREVNREIAVGSVLLELLNTLDDIDRAREAGELEGAFKAVSESVERVVEKAGLVKYGEVGDPFDPRIHEALMHNYSDDVDGPTCTLVMQPGYRLNDRILRAARVAVSEPTEQLPETTEDGAASQEQPEDK